MKYERLHESLHISDDGEDSGAATKRSLKARHLQMIAIGGTIGTGLFIGSGTVLKEAGPLGVLIAYLIAGVIVYFVLTSVGEMSALFPVAGSFFSLGTRFVEPALGFSIGWNYWLIYAFTLPAELVALANLLQFWWPDIPKWAIILSVLALVMTINLCGVGFFGELEYWLSMIKVVAVVAFILNATVLCLRYQTGFATYQAGYG
ncbi:hypothetical protein HDU91_006817, partial [Kappamyces sp. JEL0680]